MNEITRGNEIAGAVYSPCLNYRYSLWRKWDDSLPVVAFIGLNPSTATESQLDPTVTRCIRYAKDWGAGKLVMLNLFAYRATDPCVMKAHPSPEGKENDTYIRAHAMAADMTVCAWGVHGRHRKRAQSVLDLLDGAGLYALRLTKEGAPSHPLYLPKSLKPRPWYAKDKLLGNYLPFEAW